jgi:hypothetical protein
MTDPQLANLLAGIYDLLTAGLLVATIYFYKQLVKNDNTRERRAARQQAQRYMEINLNSEPDLVDVCTQLAHAKKGFERDILQAYETVCLDKRIAGGSAPITPRQLLTALKAKDKKRWGKLPEPPDIN